MKTKLILAVGTMAALLTSAAFAQTAGPGSVTPASVRVPGCADAQLEAFEKKADGKFYFIVPDKDVKWTEPKEMTANADGDYVLPSGRTVKPRPRAGYVVTLQVAVDCGRRAKWWAEPPSQISGN